MDLAFTSSPSIRELGEKMRKIFHCFVLIACGAFFSSAAIATPTLLYEFKVNQMTCSTEYGPCDYRYNHFNEMTIGLDPIALVNGHAGLQIRSDPYFGALEFRNGGFSSIALAMHPQHAKTFSLDLNDYQPGYPTPDLDLWAELRVDRFLKGALYANDSNSEIVMATGKAFAGSLVRSQVQYDALFEPANGNEWTGFIRGDWMGNFIFPFTGEWRFVGIVDNEVPEPGIFGLLLTAMAAMAASAWVLRRRVQSWT